MSFAPKPLPRDASLPRIVDNSNSNFDLLAKTIMDLTNRVNDLETRLQRQSSVAGITETLNFNGVGSGEVLTMEVRGGSVITRTVV